MENGFSNESMLDVFIYETTQNMEQLEALILESEKASYFTLDTVNEIFRNMHTIKGSFAMMMYSNVASLAHAMENLFYHKSIDSMEDTGTITTLKIPPTLAITDGMNISVSASRYTLPTISMLESFMPKENDIIRNPDGNEMIMVRGLCYPLLRLNELYGVNTDTTGLTKGYLL